MGNIAHGGRPLDATLEYVNALRQVNPSLSAPLALHADIFRIQYRFHDLFSPDALARATPMIPGQPVLTGHPPDLQPETARQSLTEIAEAVAGAAPDRREQVDSAVRALGCGRDCLISRREALSLQDTPARELYLLALNPFYEKFARAAVDSVDELDWEYGYCPVCGEKPSISKYDKTIGTRFVQCSLCRTQWTRPRVQCAFCDNKDPDTLGYLVADKDKVHRADVCDACGRYIKAVDERALAKDAILHVEELAMASCDREAVARGYRSYSHLDKEEICQWQ